MSKSFLVKLYCKSFRNYEGVWVKPKNPLKIEKTINAPNKETARIFALTETETPDENWEVISARKV